MQNKKVFFGTKQEWLESEEYVVDDKFDDNFAVDFEILTVAEKIEKGFEVEEPEFEEPIF